jgi:hypothetical protein
MLIGKYSKKLLKGANFFGQLSTLKVSCWNSCLEFLFPIFI